MVLRLPHQLVFPAHRFPPLQRASQSNHVYPLQGTLTKREVSVQLTTLY
jgi:hypothetical protein